MNADERIAKFCQEKSYTDENLFVHKLRINGLSDEQIAIVLDAIQSTCNVCWNSGTNCRCWNDE